MVDVAVFDSHVQPTSASQVNFNPCQENNGRCQQLCFAIVGQDKPKCGCAHGSLLSNGVSCGYGLDEYLVYATDYTLNSLRLDPTDHSTPFPSMTEGYQVMAVDYDFKEKRLFYTKSMGVGQSIIGYITTTSTSSPAVIVATSELRINCGCVFFFGPILLYIFLLPVLFCNLVRSLDRLFNILLSP